jgi:GNAT superfamily N-acetyltransferase
MRKNHLHINQGEFTISTDPLRLDLNVIHSFLSTESYWARNIPYETVTRAANNSLNFGIYHHHQQIGYARVITDFATIAYLGDVFIISDFRGRGLSKWLVETVVNHTELQGLRRWILLTGDAHTLYRKFGWKELAHPERWMELHNANPYP